MLPLEEQELQELIAKEALLFCPTGLIILNAKGRVLWHNASAEQLFQMRLQGLSWVQIIQSNFQPREDDGHQVSLIDGRRIHIVIASLPALPGQLITLTDITATREYERHKEDEKRLASLGQMTAQLAHQIRTPLASASLYSEHLFTQTPLDDRSRNWVKKIQDCHSSIEQQIQDLLLFARGQAIEPQELNLLSWSERLLARIEPIFDLEGISLLVNNQLVNKNFYLHEESISGAILNLLMNSVQAGASDIHCDLKAGEQELNITVSDNGPGMSPEMKKQAFSPFYTTKARGTGLGLAVVNAVVLAHGGTVDLKSELGKGCCVSIRIPERG